MLKNSKEAACQGPRVLGCIIYSILHKYSIEPVPIFYYAVLIQNVHRNISQKMKLKLQRTGSKTRKLLHVARKVKSCSKVAEHNRTMPRGGVYSNAKLC